MSRHGCQRQSQQGGPILACHAPIRFRGRPYTVASNMLSTSVLAHTVRELRSGPDASASAFAGTAGFTRGPEGRWKIG